MREILFKAKRLDNGEWVEGGYRHEKIGEYLTAVFIIENLTSGVLETHRVDPETVCQYTGLKDKNGKKIWENDILAVSIYSYHTGNLVVSGATKVIFEDGCFGVRWGIRNAFNMLGEFANNFTQVEVIGNVFDHKEFLNED